MKKIIKEKHFITGDDYDLVSEASSLGLESMEWTMQIELHSKTRGVVVYARGEMIRAREEIGGYIYQDASGNKFTIFND